MDAGRPAAEPESTPATAPGRDFRRLRESGRRAGIGRAIGGGIGAARDALARVLVAAGATPNTLTVLGFLVTLGAGYCLARGASLQVPYWYSGAGPVGWWPMWAGVFLLLAAACDMLDGAVARLGNLSTPFGGILDSTLDRFSDMAVYMGCALHFAWQGNLTYTALAITAMCAANLISYVKARAEEVVDDCSVGYWLRGERSVALLLGSFFGHVPAMLWQQAISPLFTVLRRLTYAHQAIAARQAGRPAPPRGPTPGWRGWFQPWRCPRGSIPYDMATAVNIACVVFAAQISPALLAIDPWADPVSRWLGRSP